MLHLQGSSLATDFAVLLRRLFTSEVHTRTNDHSAQSYTSASFNSASNLCHCKKFAIASLAKLGRCTGCFHLPTLSTFAQVLSFQICTLHSFAHVPIVYDSTKPATMATLLGTPSSIRCLNFRRLIWSSSQLSRGDTRAPAMVLHLQFSVSTVSFAFLAVARLQNQLVMMPFSRGTTRPKIALRHFARRLDRRAVAREVADCVYDLTVGRSTGRTIVAKRWNERHTETGLQQSDR